ncbi:MAG: hypothetical protein HC853_15980 [Anaerolineae bacterium]|nr:hypothetical protein [Anaerolineae bacterium]
MALQDLLKVGKHAQVNASDNAATRPKQAKRLNTAKLPSTQDAIQVAAAQDNVLILRNGTVVAAVGFGSMNDALLSETEIEAKLTSYRNLLKSVQFEFQLLIGTRPQNLSNYFSKLAKKNERLNHIQLLVDTLIMRMRSYLQGRTASDIFDHATFESHFGFPPAMLFRSPGNAHTVAADLCNPYLMAGMVQAAPEDRERVFQAWTTECNKTTYAITHWQDILSQRVSHIEVDIEALQTPVRTFYFVMSFKPRLLSSGNMTLDTKELDRSKRELDRRCAQIEAGLKQMRLPYWRANHNELIEDIRHMYHPSQQQLNYELRAERSVAMRLASVR